MARIYTQRLRFSFHLLDEKGDKSVEELCQISSLSIQFALNTIPTASFIPLLGASVWEDGNASVMHNSKFLAAQAKRKYVGIYVETVKSVVTVDQGDAYVNHEFLPDLRGGEMDGFGQERQMMVRIFKGYITNDIFDRPFSSANSVVNLIHWATDLESFSMLSPKCHPANSDHMGTLPIFYNNYPASGGKVDPLTGDGTAWILYSIPMPNTVSNMWDDCINLMFDGIKARVGEMVRADNSDPEVYGSYDKEMIQRINKAFDSIDGTALDVSETIRVGSQELIQQLKEYLKNQQGNTWVTSTVSSKLIREFTADFMISVVPRIDDIKLIPAPAGIDKNRCKEFYPDATLHVSKSMHTDTLISAVWLIKPHNYMGANNSVPMANDVKTGAFPEPPRTTGTIKTLQAPAWLAINNFGLGISANTNFKDLSDDIGKDPGVEEAEVKFKKHTDITHNIMLDLAKYYFLASIYKLRTATFATPFRMDLCPGTTVKIRLPHDKLASFVKGMQLPTEANIYIYGVIESMTVGGDVKNGLRSIFKITNIRKEDEMRDENLNYSGSLFYKEIWDGRKEHMWGKKFEPINKRD